ncbi:hypothetical protein [Geminocystis sp.]|uniref:hypothetical protein n=1 Tax=Geminocystis sp. TaxID=2664100 RepID=UPI003594735E
MTNFTIVPSGIAPLSQPIDDVYNGLLASQHKQITRNTYRLALKHFANFLTTGTVSKGKKIDLVESQVKLILLQYLTFDAKTANAYLGSYQNIMIEAGLAPNTINVKLASVKALVKFAFDYEQCNFLLDKVRCLSPEIYRDTKGTSPENIHLILSGIDQLSVSGKRDYAILRLLWDNGLRSRVFSKSGQNLKKDGFFGYTIDHVHLIFCLFKISYEHFISGFSLCQRFSLKERAKI